MSKFVEYHTIEIRIPKNMLNTSKNGHVSLVPTLTKTGNISKRSGNASIILKKSDDNKPHILDQGIVLTKEQMQSWAKPKTVKSKVIKHNAKPKLLHEEVEKRPESNEQNEMKIETVHIKASIPIKVKKPEVVSSVKIVKDINKTIDHQENISNANKKIIDDTLISINNVMKFMSSVRHNMNDDNHRQTFDKIVNAIVAYDFYPTPLEYGQAMFKEITDERDFKELVILDVCSGLLSLSLPYLTNWNDKIKLFLVDQNPTFCEILQPLTKIKNIELKKSDFFDLPENYYYNKNIDVILCNPPFAFPINGKRYENGYLFFFKKIIDIMNNQEYGQTQCFFICPTRYFGKKLKRGDLVDPGTIIPESTEKQINNHLKIDWTMAEDFSGQIQYECEVDGFKTIRKGKPTKVGIKAGLFRIIIMNYRSYKKRT